VTETRTVDDRNRPSRLVRRPLDWLRALVAGISRALPRAVEDIFRDRCTQYAASLAYRVLFSLFPLTIFLVSIFGLVLQDDELRQTVIDELIDFLPVSEEGQVDVEQSIESIASPVSAIGLVSLVALLWGASGMMASIRIGLEAALKVDRGRPAAHAKLVDFILVGIVGMLVLFVVAVSVVGAFLGRLLERASEWAGIEWGLSSVLLRDGFQLAAIGVLALLLYRFVPARRLRRQDALAGATVTAVGIWGATKVLALLFSDLSRYNLIYGSLAGVMTFLFFVYIVALILLFGAEFAYAWSQPPGPPGLPARARLIGFFRGLVVHPEEEEDEDEEDPEQLSEVPPRRP
jgi:membrane protein